MKNITKLFLFLYLCLNLISCSKISPKGEIEIKDKSVENFTKLNLKGNFKVFFAKLGQAGAFARGSQQCFSVELRGGRHRESPAGLMSSGPQ